MAVTGINVPVNVLTRAEKGTPLTHNEMDTNLTDLEAAVNEHSHDEFQETLVSGTNIKTINGTNILGSGDVVIGGNGDFLSTLVSSEVSVTTTTILNSSAFGKMHVCSASADITVTLPAISGNAGKFIGIRSELTAGYWVTVTPNGSETIDTNTASKFLRTLENIILLCTSSGWVIVSCEKKPLIGTLYAASLNQNFNPNAWTKLLLNAYSGTSELSDVANNRLYLKRAGIYTIYLQASWTSTNTSACNCLLSIGVNGSAPYLSSYQMIYKGASLGLVQSVTTPLSFAANTYIDMYAYYTAGSFNNTVMQNTATVLTQLTAVESRDYI